MQFHGGEQGKPACVNNQQKEIKAPVQAQQRNQVQQNRKTNTNLGNGRHPYLQKSSGLCGGAAGKDSDAKKLVVS